MGFWIASVLLAATGSPIRTLSGIKGSGSYSIYGCVGLMILCFLVIWRAPRAFWLALGMSSSGATTGAALGFVISGALSGKTLSLLLGLKWAIGAAVLSWLFVRILNEPPEPVFEERDLQKEFEEFAKGKSDHEIRVYYQARYDEVIAESDALLARMRRNLQYAAVLLVVGAILYGSALWMAGSRR